VLRKKIKILTIESLAYCKLRLTVGAVIGFDVGLTIDLRGNEI
jgi:hypothetical protein